MADEYVLEMDDADEKVTGEGAPEASDLVLPGQGEEAAPPAEEKPTVAEEPPRPTAPPPRDAGQDRIDEINRQMGALKAQLDAALAQNQKAQPRIERPEQHPWWPKEEDWARDPNDAGMRQFRVLQEFERARQEQVAAQQREVYQRQEQERQQHHQRMTQVRQAQARSFADAVKLEPALADPSTPVRKIADTLYSDPSTGLQNLPSGAFAAAAMAHFLIDKLSKQKATGEQSRAANVKRGSMTASGRNGKTTGVNLSRDEEDVIKALNVTKGAYIQAKKDMGL